MNGNSSKQVLLSILGIAVLAVAVVGVSFAFFSYSKTGTTNNVITTGSITFSFSETNQGISLVDQFPQDEAGTETFNFKVSGTLPTTAKSVSYTVKAIKGDVPSGKTETNRLADSQVNVKVTTTGGTVTGSYEAGAAAGNSATGFEIASGTITNNNTTQEHTYSMTMWVNNTVEISDTDTTAEYCASSAGCTGSRKVYSDTFYSLKVKVDAND